MERTLRDYVFYADDYVRRFLRADSFRVTNGDYGYFPSLFFSRIILAERIRERDDNRRSYTVLRVLPLNYLAR